MTDTSNPHWGKREPFIRSNCLRSLGLLVFLAVAPVARADSPLPPGAGDHAWLDYWSFEDTNTWKTELNYAPRSFTNLSSSYLGDSQVLTVDSTNAAWINYNVTENDGTNNLTLDIGSIVFWFAPNWASTNQGGTGPQVWSRLIEVGSYTTNASYGWWSIYLDAAGTNIYFSGQTNNGAETNYLSAPISWTSNYWHFIALTYSSSNSLLYLDGVLLTNGPPITYRPGPSVTTNGFWIGSTSNGLAQAHGMFDDVVTYGYPLSATDVSRIYQVYAFSFYGNPLNGANLYSGPSEPIVESGYRAVTGSGRLTPVSTNLVGCVTNNNVWMTNMMAGLTANQTVEVTFTIAGGAEGALYDVFANTVLDFTSSTNQPWTWMGQGYHCVTYTMTNLPMGAVFLILGAPTDADIDGLPDAYERLVTKTNPALWDTDLDGLGDGWEVQFGTNPLVDDSSQSAFRAGYTYDGTGWLRQVAGAVAGTISLDGEGNVTQSSQ